MKYIPNALLRIAILYGIGLLLASCTPFSAREVDMERRSEQDSQNYYRFSAGGGTSLSFESQNFLSSNLLMDDFHQDGEKLIRRLDIRQEIEPSRMLLSVLSDVCFQLALQASDRDVELRYNLAAVYYAYQLLFNEKFKDSPLGNYDPSVFQTA